MRIAIIGQQDFGKSVLEAFLARGDSVAGVFAAPEKKPSTRRPDPLREAARAHDIALFEPPTLTSEAALTALRGLDVDLGVMAYVLQFAPQALVNAPRHGTIQYHPSLLPKYRGPSAINWPIIKGESVTGLSIFRPTDGMDEGPVILQKTVTIGPDDTVGDVYFGRLFPLGVEAVLEAADLVLSGNARESIQDERAASYEGRCSDAEAEINWHAHLDILHNLVRGCDPAPGAWSSIRGQRLRLFGARKHPARRFADVAGKPGTIIGIGGDSLMIQAQGGTLEVTRVRREGGTKTSAAAFAREAGLCAGTRLGAG